MVENTYIYVYIHFSSWWDIPIYVSVCALFRLEDRDKILEKKECLVAGATSKQKKLSMLILCVRELLRVQAYKMFGWLERVVFTVDLMCVKCT